LAILGGALTIANSTISENTGDTAGGIDLRAGAAGAIRTSSVSDNTASCRSFCGGAVSLLDSRLAVSDSTLSGNFVAGRAHYLAGAVNVFDSSATFANSTVSGNLAAGESQVGGAFWEMHIGYDDESHGLTLINTTVSNNTAAAVDGSVAGGVLLGTAFVFSPPPHLANALTLRNTIVSANAPADTDILIGPYTSVLAADYSLLGSAQDTPAFNDPSDHNIFSDSPELGPLQFNGGPTRTLALLPGSPALRSGSPALAALDGQSLNFDQRGPSHVRSFGGTVDIGAFEDQGDRLFASAFESAP
jgi:hypothetical protein